VSPCACRPLAFSAYIAFIRAAIIARWLVVRLSGDN